VRGPVPTISPAWIDLPQPDVAPRITITTVKMMTTSTTDAAATMGR